MTYITANMSASSTTSSLRYKDKVCIITGGSRGIGEGCVRVFVRNGAKVVFCGLNADEGKALEKEVNELGPGEAVYITCDVRKEDEIKALVEQTASRFGRIDCLINNAGIHPLPERIDDVTADKLREVFDVNVFGYLLMIKYAVPHLRKTRGCIMNTASLVAEIGQASAVSYVASKGAVVAMSRALAIDEAVHNVRVNTVSPGNVWTPLWDYMASHTSNREKAIQDGIQSQVLGRMATIQEAGELFLFLAAEGTYFTGANLVMSGGAELGLAKKSRLDGSEQFTT